MEDKVFAKAEAKWYDGYPAVKYKDLDTLSRSDFGGTIHGSPNLRAQSLYSSLYPSLPTLYAIVKAANISKVIWYCGSSRGRGNRAAGWFQDLITEKGDRDIASLVLIEGIVGWAKGGVEYTKLIDDYDPEAWHKD